MTNVFMFHGAYGNPSENWFPWLREELENIGCEVFVPSFPTPENQTLENWLNAFDSFERYVDEDSIFIGHSIGATFLLKLIEKLGKRIKASFLVAGFITDVVDLKDEFNRINKSFYDEGFDWERIRRYCSDFYVIGSDNDKYVIPDIAEKVSKQLGVRLIVIEGAGHFNKTAGYTKFPQLFDMVEECIAN